MRVAVVTSFLPIPPSLPGSPRLYCLCKEFSKKHRLTLYTPYPLDVLETGCGGGKPLAEIFEDIVTFPEKGTKSFYGRIFHTLSNSPHYLTRYAYPGYYRNVRELLTSSLGKANHDAMYVHGFDVLQYLQESQEIPIVTDLVDAISLYHYRLFKHEGSLHGKYNQLLASRNALKFERFALKISNIVAVVSDTDAGWIRKKCSTKDIKVVPNGVGDEFFRQTVSSSAENKIVFIGSMNYAPNVDAVLWFSDEIFPRVKDRVRDAEFWVVGANPTREVQALSHISGVNVTGTVPDVRDFLEEGAVMVCPMRVGAGIKNKVLQALAMGVPVVGTQRGFEGINVTPGVHCIVGDTPDAFAAGVVKTLEKHSDIKAMVEKGQDLVRQQYTWNMAAESLLNEIDT